MRQGEKGEETFLLAYWLAGFPLLPWPWPQLTHFEAVRVSVLREQEGGREVLTSGMALIPEFQFSYSKQ